MRVYDMMVCVRGAASRLYTNIYDHSRTIPGHLRSPKKRTRIAMNGPQMRVDDAKVCVRGAARIF